MNIDDEVKLIIKDAMRYRAVRTGYSGSTVGIDKAPSVFDDCSGDELLTEDDADKAIDLYIAQLPKHIWEKIQARLPHSDGWDNEDK